MTGGRAQTLILTRPEAQSREFAAALADALPGRFRTVIAPLIEVAAAGGEIDLQGLQGLLFTSANGVAQFAARSPDRKLTAWCVGDMTAEAARRAGFRARSAGGDAAALARLVIAEQRPGGGGFLHVRGRHAAGDLVGRLRSAGVPARAAEIYEQAARPLGSEAARLFSSGDVDAVALFSPRTSAIFAGEARAAGWNLSAVACVSLSGAADAALGGLAAGRRLIAAAPDRAGMIAALGQV